MSNKEETRRALLREVLARANKEQKQEYQESVNRQIARHTLGDRGSCGKRQKQQGSQKNWEYLSCPE